MERYGLVLEGGGMRIAYTAGAVAWLMDHDIQFDYGAGISTGAVVLCCYEMGNKQIPYDMVTDYATDQKKFGLPALLKEGHYVAYKQLFMEDMGKRAGLSLKPLKEKNPDIEIGLYDLEKGETVYIGPEEMSDDPTCLLAACSLPLASAMVNYHGRWYLDGGITKMIPIERAVEKECTKYMVITTKTADYVRKPSSKIVQFLMRIVYHQYPTLRSNYAVRDVNYYKQMDLINELVEKKDAILVRPTQNIKSSRYKGDPENMKKLYALGYQDMEDRKEEILAFLGKR